MNYPLTRIIFYLSEKLDKFFDVENAGIDSEPKCSQCLCRNCPELDHMKEREMALIEKFEI